MRISNHLLGLLLAFLLIAGNPAAVEFDKYFKGAPLQRDADHLLLFKELSPAGKIAVPIKNHYLPMLYSATLLEEREKIFLHANI